MNTIDLNAEALRQLSYIVDDERSMEKVVHYLKKLVSQRAASAQGLAVNEETANYKPRTKNEILDGLDEACKEVLAARDGKVQLKSLDELLDGM